MGKILLIKNLKQKDESGIEISLSDALTEILRGSYWIDQARKAKTKAEYDLIKETTCPAVMWNYHGKVAYFDFDFKEGNKEGNPILSDDQLTEFKELLKSKQWVYAAWLSLSKTGIGMLIRYDLLIDQNWDQFYQAVIHELFHISSFNEDGKCKNINRRNVLSHDPDRYLNEGAIPFPSQIIKEYGVGVKPDSIWGDEKAYLKSEFTPESDSDVRFYNQTYLNSHFEYLLEEALFVNEQSGYAIFDTKMPKIRLYTPRKKLTNYRKSKLLYSLLCRHVCNPSTDHHQWLYEHNNQICDPPLPGYEVEKVWNYAKQKIESPDFVVRGNSDCFVHFFSNCSLSLSERKSVVAGAKIIRNRHYIKSAINKLKADGVDVTRKAVAELSKVTERTVTKYWLDYLEPTMRLQILEHKLKHYEKRFTYLDEFVLLWLREECQSYGDSPDFSDYPDPEYDPELHTSGEEFTEYFMDWENEAA